MHQARRIWLTAIWIGRRTTVSLESVIFLCCMKGNGYMNADMGQIRGSHPKLSTTLDHMFDQPASGNCFGNRKFFMKVSHKGNGHGTSLCGRRFAFFRPGLRDVPQLWRFSVDVATLKGPNCAILRLHLRPKTTLARRSVRAIHRWYVDVRIQRIYAQGGRVACMDISGSHLCN